jgi:hypothetical protein
MRPEMVAMFPRMSPTVVSIWASPTRTVLMAGVYVAAGVELHAGIRDSRRRAPRFTPAGRDATLLAVAL